MTDDRINEIFQSVANDDPDVHLRFARALLRAELARPQAAVGTFDGHAVIEAALKKATKGNLADAPFPMTGEAAQAYLMGLAAAYQHALEMIPASRVPVASPAEPVAPVSFVVRHADRSVRDTSMSVGDSVAEPDSVHPDSGECGGVQKPGPTDADLLKLYKGDDYGDTHQFALLDFAHAVIASSKGGDQGEGK